MMVLFFLQKYLVFQLKLDEEFADITISVLLSYNFCSDFTGKNSIEKRSYSVRAFLKISVRLRLFHRTVTDIKHAFCILIQDRQNNSCHRKIICIYFSPQYSENWLSSVTELQKYLSESDIFMFSTLVFLI
jgi:hypothetical protein